MPGARPRGCADGGGKLEAVPGQKSGILAYGEQRGAGAVRFDGDGRVDVAVQPERCGDQTVPRMSWQTRFTRAAERTSGTRMEWAQRCGWCLGTDGSGAEIHGGSGYWVAGQRVQVMGCPELRLKFGAGGRLAKPPPAPSRLERRKSQWTRAAK